MHATTTPTLFLTLSRGMYKNSGKLTRLAKRHYLQLTYHLAHVFKVIDHMYVYVSLAC